MKRLSRAGRRFGYTLVEMLVATALTLVMMYAVVSIFADIGDSVNNSRAGLEMSESLRATVSRLSLDLQGLTALPRPPRNVEYDEGYLEIIEGPNLDWTVSTTQNIAWDFDANAGAGQADTTVGDFDDILMFTARSTGRPFRGRCAGGVIESDVAEICWFVRGNKLYRRVMLVAPMAPCATTGYNPSGYTAAGFYGLNDVSVRFVGSGTVMPNTLGDLTKRENRFAHHATFPHDVRGWGLYGLPTLGECSDPTWQAGNVTPAAPGATTQFDFWAAQPYPSGWNVDADTGTMTAYPDGTRVAEDVILSNVIGFDVKVYDPDVGGYVDLGTGSGRFGAFGDPKSQLVGSATTARVYCTWSDHYERDGIDQDGLYGPDAATNGFDDDGVNGVDDIGERDTMPPYPFPLRGIQVKIRVFEPDSQQVRELTLIQDFLPK